jgi:CheY-like chemotaxis protein
MTMMTKRDVTILIAEDDDGHASLIQRNLRRAGWDHPFIRFRDGLETREFLFSEEPDSPLQKAGSYLLLLDIRLPKVNGIEILRAIKEDPTLRRLPVVILTTTDDPKEVKRCHELGCSCYIRKPLEYPGDNSPPFPRDCLRDVARFGMPSET